MRIAPPKAIWCLMLIGALVLVPRAAAAADLPKPEARAGHTMLPQEHQYQRALRQFMATLTEQDFVSPQGEVKGTPPSADADEQFRTWMMEVRAPSIGSKRNYSSMVVAAKLFTLDALEGAEAVMRPPVHPEPLVELANWNSAGNPYFNSKTVKMRAFVVIALDLMMFDDLLAHQPNSPANRSHMLAGTVLRLAYSYPGVRDVLPKETQQAFEFGLRKLATRSMEWGPGIGALREWDTVAIPALYYAGKALRDPQFDAATQEYCRKLLANPSIFSPAGYFVLGGSMDAMSGISAYYAVWGAIASDWPFAREAVAKTYRLRTHLMLPEPDGSLVGPTHMCSLLSQDFAGWQWNWPFTNWAAALVSDEAACLTHLPSAEALQKASEGVASSLRFQIGEVSWVPKGMDLAPWGAQPPPTSPNFASMSYPKGYYAKRLELEKSRPALAKLPFQRDEVFVHTFADEIAVIKSATFGVILHTGPSGEGDKPLAFGGGALSAFWTPQTGAVILGRNRGAWKVDYDKSFQEWRTWPTHAVTGANAAGKVFTSAKIPRPEATFKGDKPDQFEATVRGEIPPASDPSGAALGGKLEYRRTFRSTSGGLHVTTGVKSIGSNEIAEMYEVIPVYLGDSTRFDKAPPTKIEWQIDGAGDWAASSDAFADKVTAVRLTRFGHAVVIKFDRPRRAKLSPADWVDNYLSRAVCRNIMVDLAGEAKQGGEAEVLVAYEIAPVK